MARRQTVKKKPYEDLIKALTTRNEYYGRSVCCYSFPRGGIKGGFGDEVPAGTTYVVSLESVAIAWIDKDGVACFTTAQTYPREWGPTDATWKRYITLCKKYLIDAEKLKADEDEAIASIKAMFIR